MSQFWEVVTTLGLGFMILAGLAVFISRNANTAGVIQASASGFGNILDTAISPVTGATVRPNLSYPAASGFSGFGMNTSPNMYM